MTDKFIPSTQFIEKLPNICVDLELVSVYDMDCYSVPQLLYRLAQKINDTITNMEHNDTALKAQLDDLQVKLEYLLDEGLMTELQKIFEKMYADGTLQSLVEESMVDIKRRLTALENKTETLYEVKTVEELQEILEFLGDKQATINISRDMICENIIIRTNNKKIIGRGVLKNENTCDFIIKFIGTNICLDGLTINRTVRAVVNLIMDGENNRVENCKIYSNEKLVSSVMLWTENLITIYGDKNVVSKNELYNGGIGLNISGSYNQVLNNHIHDNMLGVYILNYVSNILIDGNIIAYNDVAKIEAADGILVHTGANNLTIVNNTIQNSGEHGIYFQGSNSIIANNRVFDNDNSGIKLASYDNKNEGYRGENNIVSSNVCYGNVYGVYLQNSMYNLTIDGNICRGNSSHSIRMVYVVNQDGYFDNDNVIVSNNEADFISLIGRKNIICKGNISTKISFSSYNVTDRMLKNVKILDNTVDELNIDRCDGAYLTGNTINVNLNLASNARYIKIVGNHLKQTTSDLPLNLIEVFKDNYLSITENFKFSATIKCEYLKEISGNEIVCESVNRNTLLIAPSSAGQGNGFKFVGNKIIMKNSSVDAIGQRVVKIYGSKHIIKDNLIETGADISIDLNSVTNSVISGNITSHITLRSGCTNNIAIGNISSIGGDAATNTIKDNYTRI